MLPKGWQLEKFQALVSSIDAGVSVNGEDRPAGQDEFGVLKISAVTSGVFQFSENKVISGREIQRAVTQPIADRIIISRSNTELLVGASAYVERDFENLYLSDKLWQIQPRKENPPHMQWLAYWLASSITRAQLSKLATGTSGSMKNITKGQLLSLDVPTPPVDEQRRVAKIISTWDQAIASTERLIANSLRQKKLLAQRMLTGKVRLQGFSTSVIRRETPYGSLPADWGYLRIGEVATEVSQKLGEVAPYPVLSCTKHHGLVDSLSYFNKQVFSLDTSTYKVVPKGCFVYATNHIDEGSIGYQDLYDFGLVSPMYTSFKTNDDILDSYLFSLLKTEHYRQIFASATNASVDRRGSLRWKDFKKLYIPVPPIDEQRAIANVLMLADRDADFMQRKLDLLRKEKSALMDQLLTGRRRVHLSDSEKMAQP